MWSEKHQTAHAVVSSGVDESDGAAVAVPDQDRVLDLQFSEKIGQRVQRFVVHIADGTWLGEEIGVAAAIARVDRDRTSRGLGNARGEVSPVRDRAQAFVKEDEF